jgi:mono/diheme cytochrome c family protein
VNFGAGAACKAGQIILDTIRRATVREVKLSVLAGMLMVVGLTAARNGLALAKAPLRLAQGDAQGDAPPRPRTGPKNKPISRDEPNAPANPKENSATVAAGKAIFEQRCAICHYTEGTAKKIGFGLKGLYPRGKFAAGGIVDDLSVASWIEKGGKDMPGFRGALKPEQIRALVAYVKTL